jgi:rhamnose utilization protein RhaD (predicted bifunctional aldolase and dehydrogenase)
MARHPELALDAAMQSRWNDEEAARWATGTPEAPDLGLRVYTSRLLGARRDLVLHGGGNTSVKLVLPDALGDAEPLLLVKGSGRNLASVERDDFSAVRLGPARRLLALDDLDDERLLRALTPMLARAGSPKPSIETLLHAALPAAFVEHTHADAVLAVVNTDGGPRIARELFGDLAPLVPFHPSGFALAKACARVFHEQATSATIGLILLHHGVVAFGDSARASYENMLRLVGRAQEYLAARGAWELPGEAAAFKPVDPLRVARLRREVCAAAGFPLLMRRLDGEAWQAYARRADLAALSAEGPATPQHAVFIKREPLLGTDAAEYARRYRAYVAAARPGAALADLGLDPAPRAVLDPVLGVWVAGISPHYLEVTAEILTQDREIKTRAAAHDRYRGLPPAAILEAELHYGGFERKLRESGAATLLGEAAVVMGRDANAQALCEALARGGAAVTCLPAIDQAALCEQVRRFGGLDLLALVDGGEECIDACAALLALAPRGGRILAVQANDAGFLRRLTTRARAHRIATVQIRVRAKRTLSPVQADLATRLCDPMLAREAPALALDGGDD